ncbi:MAG: aminoacyl-tRNA hydrolase [Clostridia bacterium]|nr:aminoacyl-tRNA hydrolase [Clostridia bacterium]
MYIIVGLGNPGREYENTRHNAGFWAIDALARAVGAPVNKRAHSSLLGECRLDGEKVLLVKPQTYMNLSGHAVSAVMHYYKADIGRLIVVYDDKALPAGMLRIRAQGSAGGHNGMQSIIEQLGTDEFLRIRVGIGGDSAQHGLISHVLGTPGAAERAEIDSAVERAADAARLIVAGRLQEAQEKYNRKAKLTVHDGESAT